MAAEISPTAFVEKVSDPRFEKKPALLSKIEASGQEVNCARFLPTDDGVITVGDDKFVKIWVKKENGQYWPALSHPMPEIPTCVLMNGETKRLLVGQSNGTIAEFRVKSDYRSLKLMRTYLAHQASVTNVMLCLDREWVFSTSRDKYFQVHCSETGRRLGGYQCNGTCTSLAYDDRSCYAFVGDFSGAIHVVKCDLDSSGNSAKGVILVTIIRGHTGCVQSLAWDPEKKYLYSGSADQSVIIWDIGGQKGTAFELHGHSLFLRDCCVLFFNHSSCSIFTCDQKLRISLWRNCRQRVMSVYFVPTTPALLLSSGDDAMVAVWDADTKRSETPEWRESNNCELCGKAFFWNVTALVSGGDLALRRQHHCRACGRAICSECSPNLAPRPKLGFEFPVRVCSACWESDPPESTRSGPMTRFFDSKQHVLAIDVDLARRRILTLGQDRIVKLWDLSVFLDGHRGAQQQALSR
ncbi:unnamed protein product [Notodromas monacha]|uniref:FYVE-type domain-containing protein n=1 Tax=Notodromas monacha TaxID=399045 RepID=A0A7R9BGV2_9CRUS|nr:unnamed protein product [Notodromas monacha]CAG0913630.1 unnamed protein product [Notodromas monacha]